MKKINLIAIGCLFVTSFSHANPACEDFEIRVKNKLADDLLVTKIELNGADIQPHGIQKLNAKSTEVFTVNNTTAGVVMKGSFIFHTISLPSKEVKIEFDLNNVNFTCVHNDHSPESDYVVDKTRLPGKVTYTISSK